MTKTTKATPKSASKAAKPAKASPKVGTKPYSGPKKGSTVSPKLSKARNGKKPAKAKVKPDPEVAPVGLPTPSKFIRSGSSVIWNPTNGLR